MSNPTDSSLYTGAEPVSRAGRAPARHLRLVSGAATSPCQAQASPHPHCPWQTFDLDAPLACVTLRAGADVSMLAMRRVRDRRGDYLHAHLSPHWPGCTIASRDPDRLHALLPPEPLPMLCDLRHGQMSDFPGVLLCCLRVAARAGDRCVMALLVGDGAGESQAQWMESLANAVGVEARTFVDRDTAVAWMHG